MKRSHHKAVSSSSFVAKHKMKKQFRVDTNNKSIMVSTRMSILGLSTPWLASLELSRMILDAAQSGTDETVKDIISYAEQKIKTIKVENYNKIDTAFAARTYAEAATLFFLAVGDQSTSIFSIICLGISTCLLHSFTCSSRLELKDFKYILECLAVCGYTGHDTIIQEILNYLSMLMYDSKRISILETEQISRYLEEIKDEGSIGYWLHLRNGEPLKRLWQYSSKKKKIRDDHVDLTPGTRRVKAFKSSWQQQILGDFTDTSLPLVVDLGCGYGVSLLGLARNGACSKGEIGCNYIGCDLSTQAVAYANNIAIKWGLKSRCHVYVAAVETFLEWLVDHYPGPIIWILIQFPTPYRLTSLTGNDNAIKRNSNMQLPNLEDGFMVTQVLIDKSILALDTQGILYVQSNVEDVAVTVQSRFESSHAFNRSCFEYCSKDCEEEDDGVTRGLFRTQRQLEWTSSGGRAAIGVGWLQASPLPPSGRTETEATYQIDRKPVYRIGWRKLFVGRTSNEGDQDSA